MAYMDEPQVNGTINEDTMETEFAPDDSVTAYAEPEEIGVSGDGKREESKEEKFIRLAEVRMNKAIDAIGRIGNLSNRSTYSYTDEQIEQMFTELENKVNSVRSKFYPKNNASEKFHFGA